MAAPVSTAATAASALPDKAKLIEQSKKKAAYQAVQDHLDTSFRHIGIGSGSTVIYVVEAIAAQGGGVTSGMTFYPTGDQSRLLIEDAGLRLATISQLPLNTSLDVCFDGADEVDEDLNLIKGGGACLFQEKIVATASKKFVCVAGMALIADYRKLSPRLGTNWKQGIPIEVLPLAAKRVQAELVTLGSLDPQIRQGLPRKAGPVVTDNSMWLIDAPFSPLQLAADLAEGQPDGANGVWTVDGLADRLIRIPGIVETGLFTGFNGLQAKEGLGGAQKPVAAYFGMADGSVQKFLGIVPLHIGTELIALILLFNKLTGVYGLLAILTGYSLSATQLSAYLYNLAILILLAFCIPHIRRETPLPNFVLACAYAVDTAINALYTTAFAASWYFASTSAGPTVVAVVAAAAAATSAAIATAQSSSFIPGATAAVEAAAAQASLYLRSDGAEATKETTSALTTAGAVVATATNAATTAAAAAAAASAAAAPGAGWMGKHETAASMTLIIAVTAVRFYFSLVVISHARNVQPNNKSSALY